MSNANKNVLDEWKKSQQPMKLMKKNEIRIGCKFPHMHALTRSDLLHFILDNVFGSKWLNFLLLLLDFWIVNINIKNVSGISFIAENIDFYYIFVLYLGIQRKQLVLIYNKVLFIDFTAEAWNVLNR